MLVDELVEWREPTLENRRGSLEDFFLNELSNTPPDVSWWWSLILDETFVADAVITDKRCSHWLNFSFKWPVSVDCWSNFFWKIFVKFSALLKLISRLKIFWFFSSSDFWFSRSSSRNASIQSRSVKCEFIRPL